ncbi:MAG: hypothetical protein QXS27_08725 [Candidatus Jordarchaeaceae archaeon]
MKLGELLEERARLIEEIAGLLRLRESEFMESKESPSEVRFKEITEQINQKRKELRNVKIKIMRYNLSTKIEQPEVSNLMELNLKITDLIAEIEHLRELARCCSRGTELRPQVSAKEMRQKISALIREKIRLDILRKMTNWATEVD